MHHLHTWFIATLTLSVLFFSSDAQTITLTILEISSPYHPTVIDLACNADTSTENVQFVSRIGGTNRTILPEGGGRLTTVEINPLTEGEYFCQVGNLVSNTVILVAYPFPDPNVPRSYTATLRQTLAMNCTIPFGVLHERYSVEWFKGITMINETLSEHLSIRESDGALIFNGVQASDDSRAYYCKVSVLRNDNEMPVIRVGSPIALNVMVPLEMTAKPMSVSAQPGSRAEFTCSASGVPAPELRWLVNGIERRSGVTNTPETRETTIHVTSTLGFPGVNVMDTGTVTCLALHSRNEETSTITATANLIVLTNNFTVGLSIQDGDEIRIRGVLPVPIVGSFCLQVQFQNGEALNMETSVICDPSLRDTATINIEIPKEKLPNYNSFSIAVAIIADNSGKIGPYTVQSNVIELPSGLCNCRNFDSSSNEGSNSNNSAVVTVLSILVVLVLIGIVVLVAGCALLYYKRVTLSSEYRASLSRSVSHYSCASNHSRVSNHSCASNHSRASNHSSCSSHRSCHSKHSYTRSCTSNCSASQSACNDTKPADIPAVHVEEEHEEPKDVRDYETIDNRVFKEERKANLGNPRFGRSLEAIIPRQEVLPTFPCTNPVFQQHAVHRDSDSSFEDLEHECQEFRNTKS